jgi:oxygen-independent coproporphyrinogen III oxidase
MAGIYIHIPFCRQACHYCDFHFSTSLKTKDAFIEALRKEVELRKDYLSGEEIQTVYFGGGTPSLLSYSDLSEIFEVIYRFHSVNRSAEITLEANPDDLTGQKLDELRIAGINRLSIGIQSFSDADLRFMNRLHTGEEAFDSVRRSQDKGFLNISIDLIYGVPTAGDGQWISNLEKAFLLGVPHISAYCLTVEEGTALEKFIKRKKVPDVDETRSVAQFRILMEEMEKQSYEQYEISNFCKEGAYSRHNSSYWKGDKYLGLGPSAHSFDGNSRQWNVSNNHAYIRSVQQMIIPAGKEELTNAQRYNEYILTSLRTVWGCDRSVLRQRFGEDVYAHFCRNASPFLEKELLVEKNGIILLTADGKLLADHIASGLFI